MNASLIRSACERRGMDYAKFRREHRASWTWTVNGEWYPAPWGVSDKGAGFDVTCACGWQSRTGGAMHVRVREAHYEHLLHALLEVAVAS